MKGLHVKKILREKGISIAHCARRRAEYRQLSADLKIICYSDRIAGSHSWLPTGRRVKNTGGRSEREADMPARTRLCLFGNSYNLCFLIDIHRDKLRPVSLDDGLIVLRLVGLLFNRHFHMHRVSAIR